MFTCTTYYWPVPRSPHRVFAPQQQLKEMNCSYGKEGQPESNHMISHVFLCVTSPQQFFFLVAVVVVVVAVYKVRLIFSPLRHILTEAKEKKKKKKLQGTNCPERLGVLTREM